MIKFYKVLLAVFLLNVFIFFCQFFGQINQVFVVSADTKVSGACGPCCNHGQCNDGFCEAKNECVCAGAGASCDLAAKKNIGQCQTTSRVTFCPDTTKLDVTDLVNEIIKWIMIIGLVVTPLMIIFGGFFVLTSQGDSKRTTTGKNIIKWAVIGLAIILFAKAFVSILKFLLG